MRPPNWNFSIFNFQSLRVLSCATSLALKSASWPCLALAPPLGKPRRAIASSAGVLANGRENLQLIVNNARFLILPWVQSKNLASKLLALAARQLPEDWYDRYAYRPVLLETFVDTQRFTGACYQAANWIHVGQTQGRGKLDRDHKADLPTKKHLALPPEQTLPKVASLHLSPQEHRPLVIA